MSNLLPPNATITEVNLDEALSRIENVPTPARTTINPDTAPASILPWMAWAQSVDNWDVSWTEQQKRAVIKAAYAVHRQKGTVAALRIALEALGYNLVVQEWYQQIPAGDPYTFDVILTIEGTEISATDFQEILAVIEANKNLRSHLKTVKLVVQSKAQLYVAAATVTGNEIDFKNPAGTRLLDGTWALDGTVILNGLRIGS